MADFVAVLRKTIGSLGENTPEMREKVFDKARSTIEAKLQAIQPPPPAAVVERQRKALEDAIATLRADYAEPETSPDSEEDALETVLAAFEHPDLPSSPVSASPVVTAPVTAPNVQIPEPPRPEVSRPEAPKSEAPKSQPPEKVFPDPVASEAAGSGAKSPDTSFDVSGEDRLAGDRRPASPVKPPVASTDRRSRGGLIVAALIVVLAAAGGGYFWWSSGSDAPAPVVSEPIADGDAQPQQEAVAMPEPTPSAEQDVAAPTTEDQAEASPAGSEKFTQRLLPDGSEVDEGRAGGEPGIGEGSSVATAAPNAAPATTPSASETTTEPQEATTGADDVTDPATNLSSEPASDQANQQVAPADQPASASGNTQPAAVNVGQRAIFYEERTSTADGSAEIGSIAWSLVQESPGGDLPPEPAIRAEATIPDKDVQLRMTIRRNGDQTLPASHIVEMIFLTPEGFGGGGVTSVSRIAFKETEQAAGSPLIGIPAKIADGFFLIALSDAPAETQSNLNLLARQSWIDIPIVYQSGQRALLSLEKGIPGERVFQEALGAWESAASN